MVDVFLKSLTPYVLLGICFVASAFLINLLLIPILQITFYYLVGQRIKRDYLSLKDKDTLLQYSGILVIVGSIIIIIQMIAVCFFN